MFILFSFKKIWSDVMFAKNKKQRVKMITLESIRTISIVRPPAAEYCLHKRMILTLIFHIDLNGFKSHTTVREAIFVGC